MYVARIGNLYVLKRLPNKGMLHHPDCDSYEVPAALSGKATLADRAIVENHDTGLTALRLGFPLSKSAGGREAASPSPGEPRSVSSDPERLSLRGLLEYLYEEAGLSRWSPGMAGKRNWFIVRRELMDAAQNKVARKTPVSQLLWIPELFDLEKKDEISTRRRHFFNSLKATKGKTPLGLMIGEVKNLEDARFGGKIVVKHMPGTPMYLPEDLYRRVRKAFANQIAMFEQDETMHLLFMASFQLSASGYPQAESITFMMVDQNWLPFENIEERELLERLVSGRRRFLKAMRFNLGPSDVLATAIITDTTPDATAFYIIPMGATEAFYDELDALIEDSGTPAHIWDVNEEVAMTLPEKHSPHTVREIS